MDALEFQAWQRKMAAERSRGQFFKSLYQADDTPIVGEDLSMLKVCFSSGTSLALLWKGCSAKHPSSPPDIINPLLPAGSSRGACNPRLAAGAVQRSALALVCISDGGAAFRSDHRCTQRTAFVAADCALCAPRNHVWCHYGG